MSLAVSKACFPDSSHCHNCERKVTKVFTATDPKENSKRCSNCHLMTYCDRDCQKEHWIKVHKKHCRFLSGKSPVKNSKHDAPTCLKCIQDRETTHNQIMSAHSPKTTCHIEVVTESMKDILSSAFGFHGEGKKCDCSLKFGLQLPFALGEVSGQYLEIAGTGPDPMLARALRILDAMMIKYRDEGHRNALGEMSFCIMNERAHLWLYILTCGKPRIQPSNNLSEQVESLRSIFGASNPWWKILNFSVTMIIDTINCNASNFYDSRNLEDPRFPKLKLLHDYTQSQLQNQAMVSEMKMWPNFMLWPQLVNGKLAVLLPPGTSCHTCNAKLTGEAILSPEEVNYRTQPIIFPHVGHNGALVAFCSPSLKPSCVVGVLSKNVYYQIKSNETEWKEYLKEVDLFTIESRECDFCLKSSLSSHRCSACLAVQYCSTTCQVEDKEFHNSVCSTWAKDESRKIDGRKKQKQHWKKGVVSEK